MSTTAIGAPKISASAQLEAIKSLIQKSQQAIAAVAPKHLNAERLGRLAATVCQRDPKLLECAPVTTVGAILQAAALGLDVNDGTGQAYLVPFWNSKKNRRECQFIPGYMGFVKLAHNTGIIKRMDARVVHAKDEFSYEFGTHPVIKHRPSAEADPGQLTHVYLVVEFLNGGVQIEVMNRHEVEAIRRRSPGGETGPWKSDYDQMARKSVVRRARKMIPAATEASMAFHRAAALDDKATGGQAQDLGTLFDEKETATPHIDTTAEAVQTDREGPTAAEQAKAAIASAGKAPEPEGEVTGAEVPPDEAIPFGEPEEKPAPRPAPLKKAAPTAAETAPPAAPKATKPKRF